MLKSTPKRMSQKNNELEELVTKPEKMIYLIGALCLSIFSCCLITNESSWLVAGGEPLPVQKQISMVKGESIKSELAVAQEIEQIYKTNLTSLLRTYLNGRVDIQNNINAESWLAVNSGAQESILGLRVPKAYQKLHLELMMVLGQEREILMHGDFSTARMAQVNSRFREIFKNHDFLN